ncbi:MAG: MoaD/ThiS family protein [Acidobacteriota bacterium]|jgi:molybdopterin converting factor small subunit|nr:MoaD/ThiS family protein [Acidobacteriota bacterium]
MINVKVLFFGATADSVGEREVEISFDEKTNATNALDKIFAEFPNLQKNHDKKSLHFSINQEYANGNEIINDGDELAVFTAVSGG